MPLCYVGKGGKADSWSDHKLGEQFTHFRTRNSRAGIKLQRLSFQIKYQLNKSREHHGIYTVNLMHFTLDW